MFLVSIFSFVTRDPFFFFNFFFMFSRFLSAMRRATHMIQWEKSHFFDAFISLFFTKDIKDARLFLTLPKGRGLTTKGEPGKECVS